MKSIFFCSIIRNISLLIIACATSENDSEQFIVMKEKVHNVGGCSNLPLNEYLSCYCCVACSTPCPSLRSLLKRMTKHKLMNYHTEAAKVYYPLFHRLAAFFWDFFLVISIMQVIAACGFVEFFSMHLAQYESKNNKAKETRWNLMDSRLIIPVAHSLNLNF